MNLLTLPVALLATTAASISMAAGPGPAADSTVRELGRDWLARNDGVGLSIGVYDAGRRQFYHFGTTQLDGNRPPDERTVYEIGSISKAFTAQLLARAVVEGRAALTDEVEKYLDAPYPNLAGEGQKIQLLHLANMTSQLVDNIPDFTQLRPKAAESMAVARMRVLSGYTREEFLKQLRRVAPRDAPGEFPANSNVGSMLLGVALEKIYGEPFAVIVQREIEKPLKMASGTRPDPRLLARGYTDEGDALPPFEAELSYPSIGLRYSVGDLLRFATWQMVERDASVKLAHRPTWQMQSANQGIALHWVVFESPHGRRLHCSGSTHGFAGVVDLYPDAGLALVLLSNKDADGAQDSLRAVSVKIAEALRPPGSFNPKPATDPPAGR
jgi:CubicO group peptidase (beta-lactamase class C family)